MSRKHRTLRARKKGQASPSLPCRGPILPTSMHLCQAWLSRPKPPRKPPGSTSRIFATRPFRMRWSGSSGMKEPSSYFFSFALRYDDVGA